MDLLSQAVEEMRLRRVGYRRQELAAPAVLAFSHGEAGVHIVVAGSVAIHGGDASISASEGDFILFPRGEPHEVCARGGAAPAELISGHLEFEAADHPLFNVLPAVIQATHIQLSANPRCADYARHLVSEVRDARDGADVLLTRLTDILFIEVMRFFTPPPGVECPVGGWFSALNDEALRRVLSAVHEDPGRPWTVASLAEVARESRSAFAAHFANVMKEPPMAYLSRWRMFRGRALLRQTDLALAQIAERVGYGSAAAFSLAFTREHSTTPGAYRALCGATDGPRVAAAIPSGKSRCRTAASRRRNVSNTGSECLLGALPGDYPPWTKQSSRISSARGTKARTPEARLFHPSTRSSKKAPSRPPKRPSSSASNAGHVISSW